MAGIDHYTVLDLKPDAGADEIKRAYRSMAIKTHPDRGGAAHLFRMVQEAYETLSDPDKRSAYDRQFSAPTAQAEPAPEEPSHRQPEPEPAREESSHHEPEPAEDLASPAPERKRLRLGPKTVAAAVLLAGLAGYWVYQDIGLLRLTQPDSLYRLSIGNSVPAIVYFCLWGFGALVASFVEDGFTAVKIPATCSALAGAFALITATGTFPVWGLALATGLALTLAIALPVRARFRR